MLRFMLATVFLMASLAGPAVAQQPSEETPTKQESKKPAEKPPCADDAKTYCADIPPTGGRLMMCLLQNEGSLSTACRKALNKRSG